MISVDGSIYFFYGIDCPKTETMPSTTGDQEAKSAPSSAGNHE
jgi:hypothetical protein